MARKSVLNINVNAEQFKDFYEKFERYQTLLKELPDQWARVNDEVGESGESMDSLSQSSVGLDQNMRDMAEKSAAMNEAMQKVYKATTGIHEQTLATVQAHGDAQRAIGDTDNAAKSLVESSRMFEQHMRGGFGAIAEGGIGIQSVAKILKELTSVPAIGPLAGALAGAVGTSIGLVEMGNSAVQVQSQARQLGLHQGQLDAFRLNVNRYTDADSLLQNTVDAQSDLSKLPQLMMATGKSMSEIQSMSPDQLSLELMHDADKWWNSMPPNQRNVQTFQVSGLAGVMSFDQVRALGSMTNDERADLDRNYAQDSKDFNVPTSALDAAYKAHRQMDRSGLLFSRGMASHSTDVYNDFDKSVGALNKTMKSLIDDGVLSPKVLIASGAALGALTVAATQASSALGMFGGGMGRGIGGGMGRGAAAAAGDAAIAEGGADAAVAAGSAEGAGTGAAAASEAGGSALGHAAGTALSVGAPVALAGGLSWAALKTAKALGLPDADKAKGIQDLKSGAGTLRTITDLPALDTLEYAWWKIQGESSAQIADRLGASTSLPTGTHQQAAEALGLKSPQEVQQQAAQMTSKMEQVDLLAKFIPGTEFDKFITHGEGGYNIYNYHPYGDKKKLLDGTMDFAHTSISKVLELINSGKMTAVGHWQIMPPNFRRLANELGLSGNELLTKDLQDKMGILQILDQSKVSAEYLEGINNDEVSAQLGLSHVFASVPATEGTKLDSHATQEYAGKRSSYYEGWNHNHAAVSDADFRGIMERTRAQIMQKIAQQPAINVHVQVVTKDPDTKVRISRDVASASNAAAVVS